MGNLIEDMGIPVPGKRLSRLWHLGRATTDLAIGLGISGLIELAGNRKGDQVNRIRLSPRTRNASQSDWPPCVGRR